MRNPKTKHLGLDWLIFPVYVLSHLSHKKLSHSFLSKKTLPSLPSKKKTLPSLCSSSIIFPLTIPVPHSRKPNFKKKPLTRSLTLKHTSIKWHMYTSKFVRVGENRVKADINMYSKLFKRYKKEIFIGKHFCHPLIYYFRT